MSSNYYATIAGILTWHSYWNEMWLYAIYNGYRIYKSLENPRRPLHIVIDTQEKYFLSYPTYLSLEKILYLIDHDPSFNPASLSLRQYDY